MSTNIPFIVYNESFISIIYKLISKVNLFIKFISCFIIYTKSGVSINGGRRLFCLLLISGQKMSNSFS